MQRKLRTAWATTDADAARAELESIACSLVRQRPGAAASLREGLEQTSPSTGFGVAGSLLQTVDGTNPVQSMIEIVRAHAGRVKRWSSGEMALRWAAASMLAAEGQFRRVKGFRELPLLAAALESATADELGLLDLPEAVPADPTMHQHGRRSPKIHDQRDNLRRQRRLHVFPPPCTRA